MWFVLFLWTYTNADAPVWRCGTRPPPPPRPAPSSITQGRFTVNYALIYFLLGHKDCDVPAGEVGRIRWMLVVFVSFLLRDLWWEQNSLICPKPTKCTSHPRLSNPAGCKAHSECFLTLCLVCGTLMTQRFPQTVFVLNRIPQWTSLFFAVCTGGVRGQVRLEYSVRVQLRYILNPAQGHFSMPDAHWHNCVNKVERCRFGKPLQLKMMRRSELAEVWLRFEWKRRVHHLFDTANYQSPAILHPAKLFSLGFMPSALYRKLELYPLCWLQIATNFKKD